jgi:hypothetical protein
MATLTIDEVGIFRCKFKEIKPCKNNEDYCMVVVYFEGSFDGRICDWNSISRPTYLLHKADEIDHLASMQGGHIYMLKCAIGFSQGSQKDGKSYAPGVKYRILEVIKEVG